MRKVVLMLAISLICLSAGCGQSGGAGAIDSFIRAAESRDYDRLIDMMEEKMFGGTAKSKEEKQSMISSAPFFKDAATGIKSINITEKYQGQKVTIYEAKVEFKSAPPRTQIYEMAEKDGKWKVFTVADKASYCRPPGPGCD